MTYKEAADFLVALAQNDYTIDGKMLPDGKTLLDIAASITHLYKGQILYDWRTDEHGRFEGES